MHLAYLSRLSTFLNFSAPPCELEAKMRLPRTLLTTAAGAVLLCMATGSSGAATTPTSGPQPLTSTTASGGLSGGTDSQEPLLSALEVAQRHPDVVHVEVFPMDPDRDALVIFHGAVPEDVRAAAEQSGVAIDMRVASLPTAAQQRQNVNAVHDALVTHAAIEELSVSADPLTGSLDVDVVSTLSSQEITDLATAALTPSAPTSTARGDDATAPATSIAVHRGDADDFDEEFRGGAAFAGGCTGGFVVRNAGTFGISTARHCSQEVGYYDGASVTHHSRMDGAYGDARWLRSTSGVAEPVFYMRAGHPRVVTGWRSPIVGESVCKFGLTTGRTCSFVNRTDICANGYCGLTAARDYISSNGDSGGPWYNGSSARGVHHGRAVISGATKSLFTPVANFSRMNAYVYMESDW